MNPIPLVYIAGPFRGPTLAAVQWNIDVAGRFAVEVAKLGAMPVCVHSMEGLRMHDINQAADGEWWLRATMAVLEKCDALIVVPGWRVSSGTLAEVARARELDIPRFEASWRTLMPYEQHEECVPQPSAPDFWLHIEPADDDEETFSDWVAHQLAH